MYTQNFQSESSDEFNELKFNQEVRVFDKLEVKDIRYSRQNSSSVNEEKRDLNEKLIDASWKNNLDEVKKLVNEGADINYLDSRTESPYLITTSEGYVDILDYYIKSGKVDTKVYDSYSGNGTIRAAERGHAEVLAKLRLVNDDVNRINNPGYTALIESIIFGTGDRRYVETVLTLAALNADFELHKNSSTPLDEAKNMGQSDIVYIIQRVLEADKRNDKLKEYNLNEAIENNDAVAVALAIRYGAHVGKEDLNKAKGIVVEHLLSYFAE